MACSAPWWMDLRFYARAAAARWIGAATVISRSFDRV
jgi:hypothetical protein